MIEYSIDQERQLVLAKMSGVTTLVELTTHISNLARDPKFKPSFNLLFEVAQDASFSILANELEFRKLLKQWADRRKGARWAFWAPFGVTHTHMQFALNMLDQRAVQIRLFESEESALDWLAEETIES